MRSAKQVLLLLVLSIPGGAAIAARETVAPGTSEPKIVVKMINLSNLTAGTLSKAAAVAQDIYLKAGVDTEWIDCSAYGGERADDARCGAKPGPAGIILRVMPRKQAKRFGLPKPALGVAMVPASGFGFLANAFSHRVDEISHWTGAEPVTVLAHILAHEVGHLLLHQPGHSDKGLMQAAWKQKQLKRAASESLRFTETELAKLKLNVASRTNAH